jgi:hypothetical protein
MNSTRLSIFAAAIAALSLTGGLCFAQTSATLNPKFIGTWKENEAKRQIGASVPLRFRQTGAQLEELRGPEAKPLVQPVNFGAKAYAVDNSKNSIEWKQIDATHFERRIYENGKLLTTRRISLTTDGKMLTEITERPDNDVTTVMFMKASGDGKGLPGTWKPETIHTSRPAQIKVEALGANGVKVTSDRGVVDTVTFDGKPNAVTGPAVISGTMITAHLISPNKIETTGTREGTVSGTNTIELSADGKTLTETGKLTSGGAPSVTVYEKQ